MSDELLVERDGPVLTVTINRERSLNSLSDEVHRALPETWQSVKKDPSIRAIIITGAGTRAFCVGMDLRQNVERGGHRKREGDTGVLKGQIGMTPLHNDVWVPTIVAVNGLCVAGGLHFVADADVVIGSTNASFFDTHTMIGQVAALEPIGLLPRIGLANTLRMITLGKEGRLSAEDALRISLISEVVAPDQLLSRAKEIALQAAKVSPVTYELSKRVIYEALERPMTDALQHSYEVLKAHQTHPDCFEGPRSFVEKREPRWVIDPLATEAGRTA
jgi:enoyl-CoA hydratase/carnithine racemase